MSHRIGTLGSRDLDHALRDQRTGNACPEEILPLVKRPGLHHGEDKIPRELLLQVIDITPGSTRAECLRLQSLEFLLLTDVCAEGDDLSGVGFLDPVQNNGGIQTPRVGDNNFHEPVGYSTPRLVARRFERRVG